MSEKMTLEQVRDVLFHWPQRTVERLSLEDARQFVAAIDAHLATSKAQTVDVEAIRKVIETLRLSDETYFSSNAMRRRCHGLADKLTAALPKE